MATLVRERDRFNPEPEPENAGKSAEEVAAEEALLDKVHEYVHEHGLVPEFFEELWKDSRRNGTDQMTLEEINAVIRTSRADRAARVVGKP